MASHPKTQPRGPSIEGAAISFVADVAGQRSGDGHYGTVVERASFVGGKIVSFSLVEEIILKRADTSKGADRMESAAAFESRVAAEFGSLKARYLGREGRVEFQRRDTVIRGEVIESRIEAKQSREAG